MQYVLLLTQPACLMGFFLSLSALVLAFIDTALQGQGTGEIPHWRVGILYADYVGYFLNI